ncbi:pseudouridine synthase [Xylaria bambusicola]|uniref:pseudouridine synthase n=1 Tax=Xylaria bambusicola TaxID=326684 RepID=UPI002007C717|nr:pseudouridine synthase [Xylaria bambusicola]KAI0513117.1 pseudouridine synthase [Xylaria bambusicola]
MWCFGGSRVLCRSWRPHRLHQLVVTACQTSRCSFSTTTKAHYKARSKMDNSVSGYERWTRDALIKRILKLEREVHAKDKQGAEVVAPTPGALAKVAPVYSFLEGEGAGNGEEAKIEGEPQNKKQKKKAERSIDPSKYSTRLVALKLAYLGKNYGGFEYQRHGTLPTIEEELWKALVKACLIFPEKPHEINWDPWEYSKCGRTDRGVSAFGQVISLRMRSYRPLPKQVEETSTEPAQDDTTNEDPEEGKKAPKREFDDVIDELPYPRLLNRLLPPDIRILAWSPTTPAEFSARHHCRERQYRYFFTQPAYQPTPHSLENPSSRDSRIKAGKPVDGWLDLAAMRAAAKKFEGLHDFRNFCKIDGSKTGQSYVRRIFESDIVEVPGAETALPHLLDDDFRIPSDSSSSDSSGNFPKVYYFHVRGSAFLWHQIRCMVSVLFSVGQGLEDPSVIDALLDIDAEPRRPAYVLANETPLVLWNCLFPRDLDDPTRTDGMEWLYVGEDSVLNAHGTSGLVNHMWEHWRERKMDELLAGQLLNIVATQADLSRQLNPKAQRHVPSTNQKGFEGGNRERSLGKYVPLLKKPRVLAPQEAYDKEAKRQGYTDAAHMQAVIAQRRAEAAAATGMDSEAVRPQDANVEATA